jgi:serine protease
MGSVARAFRRVVGVLAVALVGYGMVGGDALARGAPRFRAGEVVVKYRTIHSARAAAGHSPLHRGVGDSIRVLRLRKGVSVARAIHDLRHSGDVEYAVPNYLAYAAGFVPNDPGRGHAPGGWQALQWNFLAPVGVDAPNAWANVIAAGAPGGRGVTVAVLDTGVAYENRGRFRRSPDFLAKTFVAGRDLISGGSHPDDRNGHGTFVAGIIAEATGNGIGATGLAYGAKIMPIRVLDQDGLGDAVTIAAGIRFAVRQRAQVINLSLEFDPSTPRSLIPELLSAIRYAQRKGVTVVGAAGNEAARAVAYPARAPGVIAVGATTEHLCLADYSNVGARLDLVAPGGGADAAIADDPHCHLDGRPGRDIYQMTFLGRSFRHFGFPRGYQGTSMAAPHVSAIAALVLASRVLGIRPSPAAVAAHLRATARHLGPAASGFDSRYGWGLVNAAAATTPIH